LDERCGSELGKSTNAGGKRWKIVDSELPTEDCKGTGGWARN